MGILDRFTRRNEQAAPEWSADDQAIARYRYMLRTAPPETIEQAHAEAFARLTPEQRRKVLQQLSDEMPEGERLAAARLGDSSESLARIATRAELRQPGTMERAFSGVGGMPGGAGAGLGGLMAGGFLSSMAGTIVGSMIAQQFFAHHPGANGLFGGDAHSAGDSAHHFGSDAAPDQHSPLGPIQDPFQNASDDIGSSPDGFDGGFDAGDVFDV